MKRTTLIGTLLAASALQALALDMPATATAPVGQGIAGGEGATLSIGANLHDTGYDGFWRTWRTLVSRYRADTNEMRYTYANDVAMKVVGAGGHEFPDGAVFGKVVWDAAADPLFPNSVQPTRVKRYTLMIKDRQKYPLTQGWGYEIYDPTGRDVSGDRGKTVAACAACHEYASNRGYVFLGSMDPDHPTPFPITRDGRIDTPISAGDVQAVAAYLRGGAIDVLRVSRDQAPRPLLAHLPVGTPVVLRVAGKLENSMFLGSIDELMPVLLSYAKNTGIPAASWSRDGQFWGVAARDELEGSCKRPDGKSGAPYFTRMVVGGQPGQRIIRETTTCL